MRAVRPHYDRRGPDVLRHLSDDGCRSTRPRAPRDRGHGPLQRALLRLDGRLRTRAQRLLIVVGVDHRHRDTGQAQHSADYAGLSTTCRTITALASWAMARCAAAVATTHAVAPS